MSVAIPIFTEYEQQVIREIAENQFRPTPLHRAMNTLGKPVGRLLTLGKGAASAALRVPSERVQEWIQEGLIRTVYAANRITRPHEVIRRFEAQGIHVADIDALRYLPLSQLDGVASSFKLRHGVLLGAEGALFGGAITLAQAIPGAQLTIPSLMLADLGTSLTLLSAQTCRIAASYGFSSRREENLPHIIAAMAPQSSTDDEGYVTVKMAALTSIRESSQFIARTAGMVIDRAVLEREAPQMIRLIAYVAERLGATVTQKSLGILLPVAGAVLNGSINIAFQQLNHRTAKDYFRRLLLEERYGDELVAYAISKEIETLRDAAAAAAPPVNNPAAPA